MNRIEWLFKSVGLAIGLLFVFLPIDFQIIEYGIFIVVLTFLGIPHGAIDHLTADPKISRKGLIFFLMRYITLISFYLISWIYYPVFSLISFILMSAYHFGQTHFIHRPVKKHNPILLYVSRGLFFLLLILGGSLEITQEILLPIVTIESFVDYLIPTLISSLLVTLLLQLITQVEFTKSDLFELIILSPILYFSPLMIAFIIYFGFWHALPSMISEYEFLKRYPNYNTILKFSKQLLPFSLISLFGIFLILIVGRNYLDQSEMILVFFILISLISFPHILYMDRFWKKATKTGPY